jgi:hypothetical protein
MNAKNAADPTGSQSDGSATPHTDRASGTPPDVRPGAGHGAQVRE